jgi:hypothetical protein
MKTRADLNRYKEQQLRQFASSSSAQSGRPKFDVKVLRKRSQTYKHMLDNHVAFKHQPNNLVQACELLKNVGAVMTSIDSLDMRKKH